MCRSALALSPSSQSFAPLRQCLFLAAVLSSSSCGSVKPASLLFAFLRKVLRRYHATSSFAVTHPFWCPQFPWALLRLLHSRHSAICTAWPPMHCAFAAPSIHCAHTAAMVCRRYMSSVVLAFPLTLPLQAGILQSPFPFLFFSTSSLTFSLVSALLPLYLLSMMHRRPLWAMTHLPSNRS